MVAQLCRDAPSKSWCVIGDCNLTLASVKTANPLPSPNPNCGPYLAFLRDVRGRDLWSAQDNRSAFSHYTYSRGPARSILDRVACSHANILDGSIDIPSVYIDATDHRPICATILLSHPTLGLAHFARPPLPGPARYRFPYKDTQERLSHFVDLVDSMVADLHLADLQVTDDASFLSLYNTLSTVLLSSASSTFQLPTLAPIPLRLRNPTIRLLLRENRRLGRLIFAAKAGPTTLRSLCHRYTWRLHTCMPFTLPQLPIPPTPPSLAFLPSYAATLPNFATGRSVPRLTPSTPGRHGRASTASYWGGPPRLFTHPCYAPRLP